MFQDRPATAMIPASDVERALAWYRDKLGIVAERQNDMGANFALAGVNAFVYPTEYAGTAEHTVLSFTSFDLVADMAALRSKGVDFIDYDLPDLKTENGLADWGEVKVAWCKDSEGNILGFVQGMS